PLPIHPRSVSLWLVLASVFVAGALAGPYLGVSAQQGPKVYELRTYTAPDGKLADLHARFRDHTLRIFQKHGMTSVVYLAPLDAPLKDNTLVYLLAHESRDAAKASWDAFRNDPEWKTVSSESQKNGPIVSKVDSVFLQATDYSPMK
ncbi:MAG: NIPSNAP family protein, partial [Vicinamibacterales bacterium]